MEIEAKEVLRRYSQMLRLARRMKTEARSGSWDSVAACASRIKMLSDQTRQCRQQRHCWSASDRSSRQEILLEVLMIDQEVRGLREKWTRKLDSLLISGGRYDN